MNLRGVLNFVWNNSFALLRFQMSSVYSVSTLTVTTAWRVLRLRMEERSPDMEGSCEYIK
jgi:hypothetical protein